MADKNEAVDDGGKSFSFKFAKSKKNKIVASDKKIKTFDVKVEETEDVDFVLATEGKEFKSLKPKKEKRKLVIPPTQGSSEKDTEAAREFLKDLEGDQDAEKDKKNVAIPLLMRNKLPVKGGDVGDEKFDVSLLPDASKADDYDDVPVIAFGAAMLRGMGWKEGEAIGLTNKGLTEPIEFIPRHKGLGLGAEKRQEEVSKRRRKPGDTKDTKRDDGPIVEKDGKVRHYKGVGETVYKHPQGYVRGAYCVVEKGAHKGIYGKIVAVDEDNARVTVKLTLGDQQITISQYNLSLADEDEYRKYSSGKRKLHPDESQIDRKRTRGASLESEPSMSHKDYVNGSSRNMPCWLFPNVRVRVISKSFKRGSYYYKKVEVVDVVSKDTCTCRTDEGRLLEGLGQSDLETVIPKKTNALVMIVDGKYKGQIGKLVERNPEKCRGLVQLSSNKHITKLDYDSMSEYLGSAGEDDFL
eukprot:Seg2619.2 transcript_id=Seg2619.2/GoldUCD/mRNA.D3Y31 product="G-patch domain and KOW motifs-containing protein" protein_id=Seg2619.2/GoldUCD/D3Y31